jgi:hypothetical protein
MSRIGMVFVRIIQVLAVVLWCIVATPCVSHSAVVLSPGPFGLGSLTYDGGQYLIKAPSCVVAKAAFRRGDSQVPLPGGNGIVTVRSAGNRVMITRAYQWGTIKCAYSVSGDQVRADVSVANATPYTIAEVRILLMGVAPPGQPITRMPGAEYNLGGPDVVFMTYGPAQLFIANEEVAKLLYLTAPRIPGGSASTWTRRKIGCFRRLCRKGRRGANWSRDQFQQVAQTNIHYRLDSRTRAR